MPNLSALKRILKIRKGAFTRRPEYSPKEIEAMRKGVEYGKKVVPPIMGMGIFGRTGARIIREVLKESKKPLIGEELEKAVLSYRYKGGGRTIKDIAKILKIPFETVKKIIEKYK